MRGMRFAVAGVLVAGMVAAVQAQPGGFGRGGFGGPAFLVANKAVQEDLKLSEDQVTKLKTWAEEFRKTSQKIREDKGVKGGGGGFGKQPSAEEQEKISAANAEITKVAYKELGEVLKKEQVTRLKQIDRQQMGLRAFSDAETVAALKLTDTQKTSMKGFADDFQKEQTEMFRDAFGGGKFDQEKMQEMQKKGEKLRKEFMTKAAEALNDDQKKTWKDLIGETFDLTKLQGGFPKKKD